MEKCEDCGCKRDRVIYLGAPMVICDGCHTVTGFWSWVLFMCPIATMTASGPQFTFMTYTGPYFLALLHWLFGDWYLD